jgi:oligopeptide/dipeptide ABC transporter ATP-binding protein
MNSLNENNTLLQVEGLVKWFPVKKSNPFAEQKYVKALDGVDFTIGVGETLGIVGESGSGKSTMGRCTLRLIEPTRGEIHYNGKNLRKISSRDLRALRAQLQIIFQDPYCSLNPRMRVGDIIAEPIDAQIRMGNYDRKNRKDRILELMELVGLEEDFTDRYPHEFSGGQRQRIGIARALSCGPKLIVCDEPVSSLDVSIQSQVINLLQEIQQKTGVAYMFISHDLSVVKHISDQVAVMYLGKIVEIASKKDLYDHGMHPYTRALMAAIPIPDPSVKREDVILTGDIPSPIDRPTGCCFHTRCPMAIEDCAKVEQELKEIAPGHQCACMRV